MLSLVGDRVYICALSYCKIGERLFAFIFIERLKIKKAKKIYTECSLYFLSKLLAWCKRWATFPLILYLMFFKAWLQPPGKPQAPRPPSVWQDTRSDSDTHSCDPGAFFLSGE